MLRQYPVTVTLIDESTARLQWDGQDETVDISEFFRTDVDDRNLIHSLRCRLKIEGTTDPTAQSILDAIQRSGGLQTPARPIYVSSITQNPDGRSYYLVYGVTAADASYGINIDADDLRSEPVDVRLLAWQIGAFLRFRGHTSLTAAALADIHSRTFRGF